MLVLKQRCGLSPQKPCTFLSKAVVIVTHCKKNQTFLRLDWIILLINNYLRISLGVIPNISRKDLENQAWSEKPVA